MQKTCCDRCGCIMVKDRKKLISGFPTEANIMVIKEKHWSNTAKEFDLCTDCMLQLREFLDGAAIPAVEKEEGCKWYNLV